MKTSHSVKWILAGAMIVPGLTACSFFGSDENNQELAATEEMEPALASNETNEAAEASTEGAENIAVTDTAVAEAAEDAAGPAGGGLPSNDIPSELLTNSNAIVGMDPTAAASMAPESAAAPSFAVNPGDVRVYYVNVSKASLRSTPAASGESAGDLRKGDPVLVKVEGNWANVVNRGWVELASLSMGPVARGKPAKTWN